MASTIRKFISTDKAAAYSASSLSQAVLVDKTLYISGQLGVTTSGDIVEGMEAQTRLALDNIGHVLAAAGATFNNDEFKSRNLYQVSLLVKVTVFLADMNNFSTMNKIYGEYFKEKFPARAAFQVAKLPYNGHIEIEAIAVVGNIKDDE